MGSSRAEKGERNEKEGKRRGGCAQAADGCSTKLTGQKQTGRDSELVLSGGEPRDHQTRDTCLQWWFVGFFILFLSFLLGTVELNFYGDHCNTSVLFIIINRCIGAMFWQILCFILLCFFFL